MRPGWTANGFADPSRPAFQPSPIPLTPNNTRSNRQNRGRMNGHVLPQGGGPTYPSNLQQVLSKDSSKHQHVGHVKYVPNGRSSKMSKGSPVPIADGSGAEGSEMLSSQLAAAPPEQQKQMLGDRLYPLVSQHKPDLAAKITGMLLDMDNSELLLLLESPESLAAKVEEAVQVLELSKAKPKMQFIQITFLPKLQSTERKVIKFQTQVSLTFIA
ncbi:unnamed protein product [Fraxinus pennsylvanica]|uniref:PABC domain-containing protein n=1 Tax=Fraxinus pennsylvanica TaxID=56036 RepID=A0AAD1Z061_9LAMI|nr:unnamed protein product [Fraxinus pennsylvanica]